MSKVSKICHRFQCIKCYVRQRHWRWCLRLLCNTAYRVLLLILLLMLKMSRMSNTMYCTLYTETPCSPRREGYLKSLPSCGFSVSLPVSLRRQLYYLSWTCQLQGWLQARCIANCMVSLSLFAGQSHSSKDSMNLLGSGASLPPERVNRAIQYLRRFSQDPPSQSNNNFHAVYLLCASC